MGFGVSFQTAVFYVFAAILLFAALRVITARNPVHAVLFLVLAFATAAGLWMLLEAEFLAIALILVYIGAVMVLFLFVVMMLDIDVDRLREGYWDYLVHGPRGEHDHGHRDGSGAGRPPVRPAGDAGAGRPAAELQQHRGAGRGAVPPSTSTPSRSQPSSCWSPSLRQSRWRYRHHPIPGAQGLGSTGGRAQAGPHPGLSRCRRATHG